MLPYYITFFISVLFCFLGEQSINRYDNNLETVIKSKKNSLWHIRVNGLLSEKPKLRKYHIFFFLSVFSVTILAWLRDYTVGTDILTYGNELFFYSQQYDSLASFIQKFTNIEPFYLTLAYISSRISDTPHILYFFTGLVIYSFLFAGMVNMRKYFPITLSWLCFLALLYGDTYNAMRQCLAIAVAFYSFHFVIEKKYFNFFVGMVAAFMFHNTAIFYVGIMASYLILQKNNKFYMKALFVVSAVGVIVFYNQILQTVIGIGLLDMKMERYYISGSTGISIPAIIIRLPFLLMMIFEKKLFINGGRPGRRLKPLNNEAEADFYIIMTICEMFTVELSALLPSLYRIALYFVPFRCLAYARICAVQKRNNRVVMFGALVIYLLIVFVYQNQIKGNNDIYPYVFFF